MICRAAVERAPAAVVTELTQRHHGRPLPARLADHVEANIGHRSKRLLADAGHQSEENLAHLEARGIDAGFAVRRERHFASSPVRPRRRITPASGVPGGWPAY